MRLYAHIAMLPDSINTPNGSKVTTLCGRTRRIHRPKSSLLACGKCAVAVVEWAATRDRSVTYTVNIERNDPEAQA